MAALHQRSSSNIETSTVDSSTPRNANFIESMEEEMRRCAEHLERRQSHRAAYWSKERKANGFAGRPLSSAAFHSSAEIGSRNSSYRSTLPRSFWSDAADQEDRSILSPRIIPPGRKSPHKSPDKNSGNRVFRFSNGYEELYSSGQYHSRHDGVGSPGPPGSYPRGNSAPPEAYPCYGAGSSASSRDMSLNSLQSPQERTPIGAVASRSRRSSTSSSSPPPVPPKPGRSKPKRAKSHTPPPPPPRSPHHTITVSSYCNKPDLQSSMDLPVDPLPPNELAAVTSSESGKELQFPSAEIELPSFPERMSKSLSISVLTNDSTNSSGPERDRLRESSAPPFICSPTPAGAACQGPVGSVPVTASESSSGDLGSQDGMNLSSPEVKQISRLSGLDRGYVRRGKKSSRSRATAKVGPAKSVEAPTEKSDVKDESKVSLTPEENENVKDNGQQSEAKVAEATSSSSKNEERDEQDVADENSAPSIVTEDEPSVLSPESVEENKNEIAEDTVDDNEVFDTLAVVSVAKDHKSSDAVETVTAAESVEAIKTDENIITTKLEHKTEQHLSPAASSESGIADDKDGANSDISPDASPVQTQPPVIASGTSNSNHSPSRSPSVSPTPPSRHIKQESPKIIRPVKTGHRRASFEIEEVFLPIVPTTQGTVVSDAAEPEVKSIPAHSRGVRHGSKHARGRSGGAKQLFPSAAASEDKESSIPTTSPPMAVSSEENSQTEIPSSENNSQPLSVDLTILDGSSEPVKEFVLDLVKQMNKRNEELASLKLQREKEAKEKDDTIKKLLRESRKLEHDKWGLLKRARDGAERSLHLRTQLDTKEGTLRNLQGDLDRTKDELLSVKSANTSLRALLSDLRAGRTTADVGVQVEMMGGTLRRNRSIELAYSSNGGGLSPDRPDLVFDRSVDHRMSSTSLNWPDQWGMAGERDRDRDSFMESTSLTDDFRDITPTPGQLIMNTSAPLGSRESRKSRKKSILNKVIRSSGRKGSKISVGSIDNLEQGVSGLVSASYQPLPLDLKEQWRILEEAQSVPFSKWDLQATLAWFEVGLGMGQYSRAMVEKYPSGGALCSITESDMEKKLGISDPLHRRKLWLAVQEKKSPQTCQYPHAGNIDFNWVAYEWAHDCGLAHLTESLSAHLVDGRVLNSLTKDDLKRYLKITKKVDQLSFLSGVELLRMHEYNREAIQQHRRNSHNPLYWTNTDVCEWLQRINLQDYAGNVIGGGIHGALLFLERGRFSAEHLANIIQIPNSKGQLRRHLTGKLAALFSDDVSGSMDSLHRRSLGNNSPLNLSPSNPYGASSQSPVPIRRNHSPLRPNTSTLMRDCHPMQRNSLTRRSLQLLAHHSVAPANFQRTGSSNQAGSQSDLVTAPSPQPFNRAALDQGERARMSLRESALRSARDEAPSRNRTVTPTVLSSTTV